MQASMPFGDDNELEMWANAQRDGRPAALFNAAMFG